MKKKIPALIGFMAFVLIFSSCAGPSRLERDYGTSYRLSKYNQILTPEAEKNLRPVTGFDGNVAKIVIEKYEKGFEKPSPPPAFILGIQNQSK